ncbi:MAG: DNA polymerase III subunit delta [Burkholderiaceae bacterium]|nr:DNA polymerase III subunit delta [Burkholderiaceae bacterium]
MQLAFNALETHLDKGLKGLYTVYGDEALLVQEACDAIRAKARAHGFGERVVHTVAGARFDWSEVLASGAAMSLFADKQLIELRIPTGKPGKEGSVALQELAQTGGSSDDTLTLVVLPRLDAASTKSGWFGALDACGVMVKVDSVDRGALPNWIAQRLGLQGQRVQSGEMGQQTLAYFADRVEGNLLAAHQEIQKLGLLYPKGELTLDNIESAVLNVARYDAFKLSEAVLSGKLARVQRMLDGLQAEGVAAVLVHWALAEDIRTLSRVKAATSAGKALPMALRENRVWGPRERLMERVLPTLQSKQLAQWVVMAHAVDGVVKGLPQDDLPQAPWRALHHMATTVCGHCALA